MISILDKVVENISVNGYNVYSVAEYMGKDIEVHHVVPSASTHMCYSVTKSVTAMCIGILCDRKILSLDDKIFPLFHMFFKAGYDKKWEQVTIRDLLTHRIGGASGKNMYCHMDNCNPQDIDYLIDVFDEQIPGQVGQNMVYTDSNYYILSRVVELKTGLPLDEFAKKELLNPMQFRGFWAWGRDPQNHSFGGDGLYATTSDLIKLGILYVNKGVYNYNRILSEDWIQTSCNVLPVDDNGDYGFAVLHTKYMTDGEFYFAGAGDQFVYFSFHTGRVVAFHAYGAGGPFGLLQYICECDRDAMYYENR